MILAVASGKGGTGKTTVSVNLARVMDSPMQLLDCDVEEPNCHLFLKGKVLKQETFSIPVPEVDESLCNACGQCSSFCQYHAIVSLETETMVFPELCHGCGGCTRVCPRGAITEMGKRIGLIETLISSHITLVRGVLDIGVAMAPPLIRAMKARIQDKILSILDAPPGTSCPVIATINSADFVLLVTEPTPFGLHDLSLAVDMVRDLGIPMGVVINRAGIGDERVHTFCAAQGIPILQEIPDDRRIAEAYSRGELIVDALPEYRIRFERIMDAVMEQTSAKLHYASRLVHTNAQSHK
jgi:MinD superfamily P-loop ATPase